MGRAQSMLTEARMKSTAYHERATPRSLTPPLDPLHKVTTSTRPCAGVTWNLPSVTVFDVDEAMMRGSRFASGTHRRTLIYGNDEANTGASTTSSRPYMPVHCLDMA